MSCSATVKPSSKSRNVRPHPLVGLLLVVAWLGGCSRLPGRQEPLPWSLGERQALYELQSWHWQGRIGVHTEADAWQANLDWEHERDQDRLRLSGPLSQGMVSIVLQKDLMYINEGGGVTHLSRDPESELYERLGFAVPLSSLRYWMLGVPEPNRDFTPLPEGGAVGGGFSQSGWILRTEDYVLVGNRNLPRKMSIQRAGVKLKLVADHWEIRS